MKVKDKPKKVTATLKVVVTGEFYGVEENEETLRYYVEQYLEDAGFDVDVELLKEQEAKTVLYMEKRPVIQVKAMSGFCPKCSHTLIYDMNKHFCSNCGQEVNWD